MKPRISRLLRVTLFVLLATSAAAPARAADVFLEGATSSTVTNLLVPRTSGCGGGDSCASCGCWPTAVGMLLAYWDDATHAGLGPWEDLLPGGDMNDLSAYRAATQILFDMTGEDHCVGISGTAFINLCGTGASYTEQYTNTQLGYEFEHDVDEWVWFGQDIADEIEAGRPVYYSYVPEWLIPSQPGAHAILLVGHDRSDETVWYYDTWDHSVHVKGFNENSHGEEVTDHCVVNTTPGGGPACPAGQWECNDGQCINLSYRCDFDPDCNDGSDEAGCQPCSQYQFRCDNFSCTSLSYYCDYDGDCGDWSDEQGCGSCSIQQIRCADGSCVYDPTSCVTCTPSTCSQLGKECNSWPNGCGGTVDCGGCGGDETCNSSGQCVTESCPSGEWRCNDGACISSSYLCDYDLDCEDGSDEWGCSPCSQYLFRCDNRQCIASYDVCDFNNDCGDGSDEQGCGLCNVQQYRCQNGSCASTYSECLCTPSTCSQLNKQCGSWPDGCGGTLMCGTCPAGQSCDNQGQCGACPVGQWRCADGPCINEILRCNTHPDCNDGSDEWGCSPCLPYEFRCDNQKCVPTHYWCDYDNDCGDGSDEQSCGDCGITQYRCRDNRCVSVFDDCNQTQTCTDRDVDGHKDAACGGDDCNDSNASVYPGASEPCDGLDNDCDGFTDEDGNCNCADRDADSFADIHCGGNDCDDTDSTVHPKAPEACDGRDNDCDGLTDEDESCLCQDLDSDGYLGSTCGGDDCNDYDPNIHPGATEVCDRIDNDCDQMTDNHNACPPAQPVEQGCGCSSPGSSAVPAWLVLPALVLAGRARRRKRSFRGAG